MYKYVVMGILVLFGNYTYAFQFLNEIEISGKIVDQNGSLITSEVTLIAELENVTYPDVVRSKFYDEITSDKKTNEKVFYNGTYDWKLPDATFCTIRASKEGYHGDVVELSEYEKGGKIIAKDLMIRLVKKGVPSRLQHVDTFVPYHMFSEDKKYGWSFNKLWYFPVDEDDTVWLTRTYNDKDEIVYTMKEPGGFVYYKGYPKHKIESNYYYAKYEWMTEAPESGYVSTIKWDDYYRKQDNGDVYCYFITPNGKYGKMRLQRNGFDYYIQPDGLRNLEAGEVEELGPVYPGYREWEEQRSR
ncbi:MAG: hypothetical protein WC481_04885 [Candidatus Omnitrophota bacterium]